MLEIKEISEIWKKNRTDFCLQYEERKFELRAPDEETCDKWVFALTFLREYLCEKHEKRGEFIQINVETGNKTPETKKKEKWRLSNLDAQVFNEIQAEHETNLIKSEEISPSNPRDLQETFPTLDNFRIMELKNIRHFFENLPISLLNSRLCMGFLAKKRKKLAIFQRQWFILASSRTISEEIHENCEEKRDFSQFSRDFQENLPPWMELDTIYYFSCKNPDDRSPFLGKIPLKSPDFQVKVLVSEEISHEYEFKVLTKDRIYVFRAELATEMRKWVATIEKISRDCQENATFPSENRSFQQESAENREGFPEKPLAKEGYLLKKSMHKLNKYLGWEKRYVSLRDDTFFWSISNTNTERRNTIDVKTLEKCEKIKENQFALAIGKKIYKFKAETPEEADKWVKLIRNSQKTQGNSTNPEETAQNEPLFPAKLEVFQAFPHNRAENEKVFENCERDTVISLEKEDEDTVFSRFFLLSEGKSLKNAENTVKTEEIFSDEAQIFEKNRRNWVYKYLCCCIFKEEDDFYSHF